MSTLTERASRIKLLVLDVDGVLTDGKLYFSEQGEALKVFSILDGQGIRMLHDAGIATALITGRQSQAVTRRAAELAIAHVFQGVAEKLAVWQTLLSSLSLLEQQAAYIGDDLPDLSILRRAGLSITVPHAPQLLQQQAHFVTRASGGNGAVREICELILAAQNLLDAQFAAYLS